MTTYSIGKMSPGDVVSKYVSPEAQSQVIAALKQIGGLHDKTITAIQSSTDTETAPGSSKLVVDGVGGTLNLTTHGPHVVALGDLATTVNLNGSGNRVFAGAGDDKLTSTRGANKLVAGSGHDTLQAGSGRDTLIAGGQSELHAGSGHTTMIGGLTASAHDTLYGGTGSSKMTFKAGDNLAIGGSGRDTMYGGTGHDTLQGGRGHDTMYGGGHSLMIAGPFGSVMHGANVKGASETMVGGGGNDQFYIPAKSNSQDTVSGGGGKDTLHLSGHTFQDAHFHQNTDGSTDITFTNNQSIHVSGVSTVEFGNGLKINPADPPASGGHHR